MMKSRRRRTILLNFLIMIKIQRCPVVHSCKGKIDDIISRGKVPIVVGGTGLFIDSLVDNISFEDVEVDEDLRQSLMKRDVDSLYDELLRVDKKRLRIYIKIIKTSCSCAGTSLFGKFKTEQNENSQKRKALMISLFRASIRKQANAL